MNKFFQMLVVVIGVVVTCSGCMTDYGMVRTTYIREYSVYTPQPVYYAPTTVRTIYFSNPLPRWHNIPNPIQGDRRHHDDGNHRDHYEHNSSYRNNGNNGSTVYVTPAPSAGQLQRLLPH
jgi:hypothetical protein